MGQPRLLLLTVACAMTLGAKCGGESAAREGSPAGAAATAQSSDCPLPPETVTRILGKPVHIPRSPVRLMDACTYRLDGDSTVEVELSIKPAGVGDMLLAGLKERLHARMGPSARAEPITLGDDGWAWAYESASGSEATARHGDKVYHAAIASFVGDPTPRHKGEMVRLVAAMISGKE